MKPILSPNRKIIVEQRFNVEVDQRSDKECGLGADKNYFLIFCLERKNGVARQQCAGDHDGKYNKQGGKDIVVNTGILVVLDKERCHQHRLKDRNKACYMDNIDIHDYCS